LVSLAKSSLRNLYTLLKNPALKTGFNNNGDKYTVVIE